MDVLVVRHAIALDKAEAARAGMPDGERPLTREGKRRAKSVARGLAHRVPELAAILTSPLRRAVETADVLARRYPTAAYIETAALTPDAEPAALEQVLATHAVQPVVAVIGHEPHLSGWVSWCLTGDERPIVELRKSGACLLHFDGAPARGTGRLMWLLTPGIARRL